MSTCTCLLGFGSNLAERENTLRSALDQITALPDVQVVGNSGWHRFRAIGGPPGQGEFLNAAAVIETTIPPLPLLDELKEIEARHGRERAERWSPRTLDIDILLYGTDVAETEMLTLPHPRMSFRRFVLEPAAEIAPKMLHPTIGWPIERLLLHLNMASDHLVLVSPSDNLRNDLSDLLQKQVNARPIIPPDFETAEHHWPAGWSTWLELPTIKRVADTTNKSAGLPYAAARFPKLSVLLDADVARRGADKLKWSTLVRQPGRGPTLRLQTCESSEIEAEVIAAATAVWPELAPA
jgi:2-amino-4-hydroxy-6-hydroxymethyldihydropteridine diphosphokinase